MRFTFRKVLGTALAACLTTLTLASCQTATPGQGGATEDEGTVIEQEAVEGATKLELWTFVELHGQFYTEMADKWNEENPDTPVQLSINVLPYDDMHNKLQIALTSGTGAPDIADIEAGKFPQFVQGTPAVLDLTPYAEPYVEDIVQARLDLFSKDGAIYGLDFHVGATVAFYNTELLEGAGIDYTTIETWEDYRLAGEAYYEATGKYFGTVDTSAAWQEGLLLAQLGGEYFKDDGTVNVNSPEMLEALTILKSLQDSNAAAVPPGGQPDTEEAFGAYNNGDFAAAVMPFWFTSRYLAYMPDFAGKIAIAAPPVVDDPVEVSVGGGGTGTAVVAGGDNAKLAAEFISWAKLGYEGNVETWNLLGFDPLNTTVWHDEEITHNPDNLFVQYFQNNPFDPLLEIEDSIGNLDSFTNSGMPAVNNVFNTQTLNDVFENDVPIQEALDQAQADLENELG
ncbi:MAG: ABC transporter substrate-binding protein [Arachnia sp.]